MEFFLNNIGPGKKILYEIPIGIILVVHQFCEDIFDIVVEPEVVCFGCFDNAVKNRTCTGTILGEDVYPVLTANRERANCLFRTVIVHRDITIESLLIRVFVTRNRNNGT